MRLGAIFVVIFPDASVMVVAKLVAPSGVQLGIDWKFADTLCASLILTVHTADVPEQAPLQCENVLPSVARADNVMVVPGLKVASHEAAPVAHPSRPSVVLVMRPAPTTERAKPKEPVLDFGPSLPLHAL
jgi:hypothetical protein